MVYLDRREHSRQLDPKWRTSLYGLLLFLSTPAKRPAPVEKDSILLRHFTPSIEKSLSQPGSHEEQVIFSERREYALEEGGVNGIVSGTRRAFTRCEDEKIRIPGVTQSRHARRLAEG